MNSGFETVFRQRVAQVEAELRRYVTDREKRPYQPLLDAVEYSLLSGGKRIRAVMILAFYGLFESPAEAALPFAAAMEMIHTYSLIHDDLPCMDDDDLRRGKPSCHIAFGEATALLAGDALLTLAFETAAACPLPPDRVLRATGVLAQAAGRHGMVGGQVMDLANEDKQLTAAELDAINYRKTGALFRASAEIGCILGGAGEEQIAAAREFARKVGLAFQVVDDVLDVTADPEKLGKPVGSDAGNHKNTYAALWGVEACRTRVAELHREAGAALAGMEGDTSFLSALAEMLVGRDF